MMFYENTRQTHPLKDGEQLRWWSVKEREASQTLDSPKRSKKEEKLAS